MSMVSCPGCGRATALALLEAARTYAFWRRPDGACPACVQQALLVDLLERGSEHFADQVQSAWPLDAEAAFGVLPTPIRLRADPRFGGRGVTIAVADSGFAAHPDLLEPNNRVVAWVDASREPVAVHRLNSRLSPRWPGATGAADHQWHGTMTTVVAAGNGFASQGLYRGMAPEARVVLLQLADPNGKIRDDAILRALRWLARQGPAYGVRVVSLSVGGDQSSGPMLGPIEAAVENLVESGIVVVAAAGNDGVRRLVPPATAPSAITVGGLDDRNTMDPWQAGLWHGNFGASAAGIPKPELVAPSIWVAAPVLPASALAGEATELFRRRVAGDTTVEARIAELKLITPSYQHVDGTSFAAPVVAGTAACLLEANPHLTPRLIKDLLIRSAVPVPGAPPERQGAGALDAGRAAALALVEPHQWSGPEATTPVPTAAGPVFRLHDHRAERVEVLGSWDGWRTPVAAQPLEPGVWTTRAVALAPGDHHYKFRLDGDRWLPDPANPWRAPDGAGGLNSWFRWPVG